jgi:hypothetical protein
LIFSGKFEGISNNFFYLMGAAQRAALGKYDFFVVPQRSHQEKKPRRSPWEPPGIPPASHGRRGFLFCEPPLSWAHKRTPKMGWQGKSFCVPVLFEISSITGK